MHKKLAMIYFNLSILIINKLTLNSVDPFLIETSHLPPFLFPQGGNDSSIKAKNPKIIDFRVFLFKIPYFTASLVSWSFRSIGKKAAISLVLSLLQLLPEVITF